MNQHEGYRQRIDDIAQQKSVKSIDVKQLSPEQLCQKSFISKGIDNGKSIGNGRKKHGQHRRLLHQLLISPAHIGVVNRIGQNKSQYRSNKGAAH